MIMIVHKTSIYFPDCDTYYYYSIQTKDLVTITLIYSKYNSPYFRNSPDNNIV